MGKKYKPILKGYRKLLEEVYKNYSDPNKTNNQNMQNAIDIYAKFVDRAANGNNKELSEEARLTSVALNGIIDDLNGNLVHYFISDNSLVEFLKNTTIKDVSIVKEYIKENCKPIYKNESDVYTSYYSVAIHSENEAHMFSYLMENENTEICVFFDNTGYHYSLRDNIDFDEAPVGRMAINLIYYLKAFPEKILDGVPQDMVRDDKKKFSESRTYNIGIADEIVEKTEVKDGRVIIPHFRSGFFRHYSDDRYVNMKGKVQFIAATMVKGKAKTVVA